MSTLNRTEIVDYLQAFVSKEILNGDDAGLNESTPLLELGVIDSLSIVILQEAVTARWGIELPPQDMIPENLESIGAIANLVSRLKK